MYTDGIGETELNDELWFNAEEIFEDLGIEDNEEEEEWTGGGARNRPILFLVWFSYFNILCKAPYFNIIRILVKIKYKNMKIFLDNLKEWVYNKDNEERGIKNEYF